MSTTAKTIVAFGLYMGLTGVILIIAPNALFAVIGLPPTNEVWIRLLGMFMVIVAYYYYRTALAEATAFFRATVHGRVAMFVFLTGLALTGMSGAVLILFGLAELTGAVATAIALRADRRA